MADTLDTLEMRLDLQALDDDRGGQNLKEVPANIVALGCYADPSWVNYEYIAPRTLTRVLELAAKV